MYWEDVSELEKQTRERKRYENMMSHKMYAQNWRAERKEEMRIRKEIRKTEEQAVNALTVEAQDEMINVMAPWMDKEGEWTCIKSAIDSGAVDSVAPATMAPNVEVRESAGSRRGQNYLSASGEIIPNQGQQILEVQTDEGSEVRATYQTGDVSRPLTSVGKICDNNERVIFCETTEG